MKNSVGDRPKQPQEFPEEFPQLHHPGTAQDQRWCIQGENCLQATEWVRRERMSGHLNEDHEGEYRKHEE